MKAKNVDFPRPPTAEPPHHQPSQQVTYIPRYDVEPAEELSASIYLKREIQLISLRTRAANFMFYAFGGLLISTLAIILLQGFNLGGFDLQMDFLSWLGAATIGEVAGLLLIVYGALFKKD